MKKTFKKGKVKVRFAVHASAEQVLQGLVDKLADNGGDVKRRQAPKGGLERDLQTFVDQLNGYAEEGWPLQQQFWSKCSGDDLTLWLPFLLCLFCFLGEWSRSCRCCARALELEGQR